MRLSVGAMADDASDGVLYADTCDGVSIQHDGS